MTSKYEGHTPGKWRVVRGGDEISTSESCLIVETEEAHIAFVFDDAPTDAALIADAPDLLKQRDALREACEVALKASWHSESFRMESWRNVVRAALALCDETEVSDAR